MSDQPYSEGPVPALRRIAFLLERSRAETYKVKAFRAAAETILPLGDEVVERVRAGTLRELPGIGASTAEVIEAAVEGRVPPRLARLERDEGGPLVTGGESVRAALRGDLHSHSDWSDGGSPIEEMAFTAIELGHEYLVLTDHSPRLTVANGLSAARLVASSRSSTRSTTTSRRPTARASGCCGASRSTSSTTATSTRARRCSSSSTCGSPRCTRS